MTLIPELRIDAKATLGEGPIWDDENQVLYWVDITANTLHVFDPATNVNTSFDVGQAVGTVVPRASGGVILALASGFAAFDLESETLEMLAEPEPGKTENRFNDGKCDPSGRFWAGSTRFKHDAPVGVLYRLDKDLTVTPTLDGLTISNGLAWSLERDRMYFIDTPTLQVAEFDYDDATGTIANRRMAFSIPETLGYPDGMTIDSEGMLWIAQYAGGALHRWDPHTGERLLRIELPVSRVTACWFGGRDLDTLFITTASQHMTEAERAAEPLAGGLFSIETGHKGVPAYPFAG